MPDDQTQTLDAPQPAAAPAAPIANPMGLPPIFPPVNTTIDPALAQERQRLAAMSPRRPQPRR
jgi:hypothetical protein